MFFQYVLKFLIRFNSQPEAMNQHQESTHAIVKYLGRLINDHILVQEPLGKFLKLDDKPTIDGPNK